MRGKQIIAGGIFLLSVCGIFGVFANAEENTVPELTIWTDPDSEYVIREAMNNYRWLAGSYGAGSEAYPELNWKIVDKSYLTPEQLRQELTRELEEGGGPDLIYMDEYNEISPQSLMEAGYLMELEDITEKALLGGEWDYLPGTLEAGQSEGRQYVLPVYVQCPVVFGLEENLLDAGIRTEEGYESLQELLEALIAAAEGKGMHIFENTSAVDWIEAYCISGDTACTVSEESRTQDGAAELTALFGKVRELSGSSESFFSPYEALENGESLVTGCSLVNLQQTAQNLAMLEKEESVTFIPIPSWDGGIWAVITQAVAVNANTSYPAEARALTAIFQESFVNSGASMRNGLPVIAGNAYWQDIFASSMWATDTLYEKKGRQISGTDQVGRRFRQSTKKAVTDAMFGNLSADEPDTTENDDYAEKKVLTIAFGDRGLGEEYPIYQWLQSAAEDYSDENLLVQLVPVAAESFVEQLPLRGAGTDIILYWSAMFSEEYAYPGEIECYADLTPFLDLDSPEGLRTVEADGEIKGISCGQMKQEDSSAGWDYVFAVPEKSELKEEAVGFCLAALRDENCRTAMEMCGYLPFD